MKRFLLSFALLSVGVALADGQNLGFQHFYGSKFSPGVGINRNLPPALGLDIVHRWNVIAINATGLDHTPVEPGEIRFFGEQVGPARASRAMAIVHMAIFDAVNGILGDHICFSGFQNPTGEPAVEAAVAQAARDALAALFPSQSSFFDKSLTEDLAAIRTLPRRESGAAFGHHVAQIILDSRVNDGSQIPEPLVGTDWPTSNQPGHWRQDPVSLVPVALGAHWGECRPFVLQSSVQFRAPAPPSLSSFAYGQAFKEAKNLGGDGVITPTQRTPEQSFIGTFWAYDGTPSLCAPPRLYNQIMVSVANQTNLDSLQLARLLAVANVAMADEAIACWDSKFHWDVWRPIHGIREADRGTGPTGLGDGNRLTKGDVNFMPLGAPASNLVGPNFTPPFPTYPSGHAAFGGALFQVMRRFYGTDNVTFTFVSDEYNGVTHGSDGVVRPYHPRTFTSFSQAEEENGQSRIYLGIHWSFDKTVGITQGRQVADYVYDHILTQPAR